MDKRAFVAAVVAVTGALALGACRSVAPAPTRASHPLTGRVVTVDAASGRLTIAHDAIPGFMDAMTMEFSVEPSGQAAAFAPGDRLRATLVVDGGRTWIESVTRLGDNDAGYTVDDARDPAIGTPVPQVLLTDQDGARFGLDRFRGRVVLLSFLYTRCPLPDYCLRMTGNFEAVSTSLASRDPVLNQRVTLLSVTIDPDHDTPEVLRAYAAAQAPSAGRFERWTFATGTADEIRAIASFSGLSYETRSGQIAHSLRTIVIGADGRVAAIFRGNAWTPDEAIAALRKAAG